MFAKILKISTKKNNRKKREKKKQKKNKLHIFLLPTIEFLFAVRIDNLAKDGDLDDSWY